MVAKITTTESQELAELVLQEWVPVVLLPHTSIHQRRQHRQFQLPIIMAHQVHMRTQALPLRPHRQPLTLITERWAHQVDQEMDGAIPDTAWVLQTIMPVGRQ